MGEPTVFVVDDDAGVRRSIAALATSADLACETYASGGDFLRSYSPEREGCLVLDVRLRHGEHGLDLQDRLRERGCQLPIIVLTGHGTVPAAARAFRHDAVDFLQKPIDPNVLLERIGEAIALDRRRREQESRRRTVRSRLGTLTRREREVFDRIVTGSTSQAVASDLGISVRTVEGHRRRVLEKMGVRSVVELVRRLAQLDRGS